MIDFMNIVEELPISAKKELFEYAEFLSYKFSKKKKSKSFKFDWIGDLKELGVDYNSVELQHQILNLWTK
jgi:hypothetical protein